MGMAVEILTQYFTFNIKNEVIKNWQTDCNYLNEIILTHYYLKTNIMEGQAIIITLILGAIAGWLGGQLFKGSGLGLIGNIVVGILGGFVGYWLFGLLHISLGTGWLGYIFTAGIGACVLLAVLNLLIPRRI